MSTPPVVTNGYRPGAQRPRLAVERVMLYCPAREWTYSHHPHLAFFRGRLVAMWSNGRVHEDDPGQRVLVATADEFEQWSEPRPLVGPLFGEHSEVVLTAGGFHQHAGTLVAYFGQYEYTREALAQDDPDTRPHQGTCLRALLSHDAEHWSEVFDTGIPMVPNHGPQPTRSGRLIISGNISFPYTDDPSGLHGWRMTGIYPPDMAQSVYDDPDGYWHVVRRLGWPVGLCEGAFYQLPDGRLHMLLRANHRGPDTRLWMTTSDDDGATWSPPRETDFTDNDTKFHFSRLPDGRIVYVGCPDPEPPGVRCPLVLSVSEDGFRFDRHFILADEDYRQRVPGRWKDGLYGYPHTLLHDGWLYVIVSLRKEAIAVLRTRIDQL